MGWRELLTRQRRAKGKSRRRLAEDTGISVAALRSYEDGHRNPPREILSALLDALNLTRRERNIILMQAGFAADDTLDRPHYPGGSRLAEAIAHSEQCSWPVSITHEVGEIIWVNRLVAHLWEPAWCDEAERPERSTFNLLMHPVFRQRLENWESFVIGAVAVVKGYRAETQTGSDEGADLIGHLAVPPAGLPGWAQLWAETPAKRPTMRTSAPLVWRDPTLGRLQFEIVTTGDELARFELHDWIPADAATVDALQCLWQTLAAG